MSRKEKVIDALVDLSVGLSAGGAGSTKAAEAAAVLERTISGLPRTSAEAGEMLALALAEDILVGARKGRTRMTGDYTDLLLRSCHALKGMAGSLEGARPGAELATPDGLGELLERLAGPGIGAACGTPEAGRTGSGGVVAAEAAPVQTGPAIAASAEPTIHVRAGKLDGSVNLVGELVIAKSMVGQDPAVVEGANDRLAGNVAGAGKLIGELQDLTMSLRMVTLKGTFHAMASLVHDLSQESGKPLRLAVEGEETEIDRNMVESLKDPLIHRMRNAVGHGIEPADERRGTGKPPAGTVSLRAYHASGHVVIEVADDGKGLAPGTIAARAAELGLVEPRTDLSDNEAFSLLFEPGFTTAEQATDVSGQGVGLDVVRKAVEALRGQVEVASRPAKGVSFTLRLPLTLAITDAMLLRVGTQRFLLPTASIKQSFRPESSVVTTVMGRGELVTLRDELLPVFRLSELFGITDAVAEPSQALPTVIEGDGRRCAVMADELLGQQQAVIKSLVSVRYL